MGQSFEGALPQGLHPELKLAFSTDHHKFREYGEMAQYLCSRY